MRRPLLLIGALILAGLTGIRAQDKAISGSFGAASFRMDDMKYLQEVILESFPVEVKIITSFPLYTVETVSILKQVNPAFRIGAGYAHSATGGRANYTDHSGNIDSDINAASHRLGLFGSYRIAGGDQLELSLYGRADVNISRIEVFTAIYVLRYSDGFFSKYKSVSPAGSAGLELLYHFNQISLGLEGGYLVDIPGKLQDKETGGEVSDPHDRSRVLTSDWTGFHSGLKFILWLDW